MTPHDARALFPGLADKTFLDAACVSLAPSTAAEAIAAFLETATRCPAADASLHHIAMDALVGEAREEAARLLRCQVRNIAIVESTTHGLNVAANAVPLAAGDNVLIADTEFLQVAIPWAKKAERMGIEVRPVHGDAGLLRAEHFERAMDRRTRAVCVSSVQWSSGCRLDISSLAAACHPRGVWLIVDAIQEMGALEVDLSSSSADFVIAGGHKWLNAPFGCGIMFVSDKALRELDPASWGYLALEAPEGGWQAYFETPETTPYRSYVFPRVARRFEIAGTTNYPGATGLAASLRLVNALGIANAQAQVLRLSAFAREQLARAGARVISPDAPGTSSGITVFRCHDHPREDRALAEWLLSDRVYVAIRYTGGVGGIRASTHFFNDEEDVMRLTSSLKRARQAAT